MSLTLPERASKGDPVVGFAICCVSLIEEAIVSRSAAVAAGGLACLDASRERVARERLTKGVKALPLRDPRDPSLEPAMMKEAAIGAMVQVLNGIACGRIDATQGRAALGPILRIVGAGRAGAGRRPPGARASRQPRRTDAAEHSAS
ncbi:MAG: hypothetical protein U1E19_03235 [Rhodoblastus sp.]